GYVDREIEELDRRAELVALIDQLSASKNVLNQQISNLRTGIEGQCAAQEKQYVRAKSLIASEVRTLLRNDLRRQDSFEDAQAVDFDFGGNRISVDGHTYFSASSRVVLKSSFFLGFLAAATKDATFRHPRFVMIDTTEDKGMEPERSHNFQNQ